MAFWASCSDFGGGFSRVSSIRFRDFILSSSGNAVSGFLVLSAPYLQGTSTAQMQELGQYSLRNKGLCLVPTSCTAGIARSNGADIWAPIKSPSPKFNKDVSPFH
ncbi:hypothetical protein NC653_031561 [Populus alba x Populus x berolinensis]|uniref:Uncharacterized protein n=1 Tax=Populus alba x Populus x berolinensis TaxID=444605 RepID=A0AAD6LYR7_9ROSI|nr:hypothetical protein NC653_031561 [Populus alba x Populus x berolinensis]